MFYVNNKQVKGIFLNGRDYNYLTYGFGKIIPEDRNAEQLNLNLAQRNLNQYRIEFGTVKDGYENALVCPRFDKPDSNGIFHNPFTYYYNGNIVPTKNVPVLITNGTYALRDALVYSDMNINGNIVYFATNSNFQGHNVTVHPEGINSTSRTVMDNCSNCNVYFDGINSNLNSFRNGNSSLFLFQDLNNCNLNLLLNNSTGLDYAFGNRLNNCNIHFENMSLASAGKGWVNMNNCNISGNVIKSETTSIDLVHHAANSKLNVNSSLTNEFSLVWQSDSVSGNAILGNKTLVGNSNNLRLNLYNGNRTEFHNVRNSRFKLNNVNSVEINDAYNTNFDLYSAVGTATLGNVNSVDFVARGGANYSITTLDNCYNSWIYANTLSGTIANVYNTRVELKYNNSNFKTWRVDNCKITGFPTDAKYTTNCTFNVSLPQALFRNSSYVTWANVWPHATPYAGYYRTKAGLESVANFSGCYLDCNNGSLVYGSETFINNNNMQEDIKAFYSGTFTANLPNYNMNIKLNVDCNALNLGIFQAGPPHGLAYSSISADNIYCTTGRDYYVQMNYGTRIYCENFCNVAFSPVWRRFSDNYQPVMLINNYQHSNAGACSFNGGIYRIGRLNFQGGIPVNMYLANGTCMFINNVALSKVEVNNALLFIGSNVSIRQTPNVYNGGLIVSRNNYSMSAIGKFVNRNNFTWNFIDSGPWGPQSLLNFCINV